MVQWAEELFILTSDKIFTYISIFVNNIGRFRILHVGIKPFMAEGLVLNTNINDVALTWGTFEWLQFYSFINIGDNMNVAQMKNGTLSWRGNTRKIIILLLIIYY